MTKIMLKLNFFLNSIIAKHRLYRIGRGGTFGSDVRIDNKTVLDIRKGNRVIIGSNVYLRSNTNGYHAGMPYPTTILVDGDSGSVNIGDNSRINGAYIHAKKILLSGKIV